MVSMSMMLRMTTATTTVMIQLNLFTMMTTMTKKDLENSSMSIAIVTTILIA